ncbi:MAG TPA: hypothetical protein VLS49_17330, partial [Usitatibacter sp.]|nr:hypothetical protein [Usitatibacter sp.]
YAALVERRAAGRRRVKERIDRGIREGDVPPGTDSAALADFYHAVFTGMSVQARDGLPRKKLIATVEAAMRAWPTEGRAARRGPRRARGEAVQGR